jgi:allantoicase
MSKLPFGWENRRNNLSEHDMKLVRVDSRGALK